MSRFLLRFGNCTGSCSGHQLFIQYNTNIRNAKHSHCHHSHSNVLHIHSIVKESNARLFKRLLKTHHQIAKKSFVNMSKYLSTGWNHEIQNCINFKINISPTGINISKTSQRYHSSNSEEEINSKTQSLEMEFLTPFEYLLSYLDVSVHMDNVSHAQDVLLHYTQKMNSSFGEDTVTLFNVVLQGWANEGKWDNVSELLHKMETLFIEPNLQSYCAEIESIVRSDLNRNKIQAVLMKIDNSPNLNLENILEDCTFISEQWENILKGIRLVNPHFTPNRQHSSSIYDSDLLKKLKSNSENIDCKRSIVNPLSIEELKRLITFQLQRECDLQIPVPSIKKPLNDDYLNWRKIWNNYIETWKNSLTSAFQESLSRVEKNGPHLSLYPFLTCLEPKVYVNIMMQQLLRLFNDSRIGMMTLLHVDLGEKVMQSYLIQKMKKNGELDKIKKTYEKFGEYHCDINISTKYTAREYWELLQQDFPINSSPVYVWPNHVKRGIGLFLFEIIMKNVSFEKSHFTNESKELEGSQSNSTDHISFTRIHVLRFLPVLSSVMIPKFPRVVLNELITKLYRCAHGDELMMMDSTVLPMIAPPLPRTSFYKGGYYTDSEPVIRLQRGMNKALHKQLIHTNKKNLLGLFDALNKLSSCAWKINEPVLDLVIEIYSSGEGNPDIGVPSFFQGEKPKNKYQDSNVQLSRERKKENNEMLTPIEFIMKKNKRKLHKKQNNEMHMALSIANTFRKHIFWLPHNADARGRAYPCTDYFKHIGTSIGDVVNSLFLFANGEELGENGLKWLQIHLVNLTGFQKKSSLQEKLKYCNEIIDDIMDSADNPLTGRKWWMKAKKPWHTLACCMELTKCLRSPDPLKYVCHLPVHQDGSANVLQHYAALGRDERCAEMVNLLPRDRPQDVYRKLAELVELERKKDEAKNIKIAKLLNGCISRECVKPFVIAVTYGASEYGSILTSFSKLTSNWKDFPAEHIEEATTYLASKMSYVSRDIFSSTKKIQYWLNKIANLITSVYQEPVQWISPLGFPIIQSQYEKVYSEKNYIYTGVEDDSSEFNFRSVEREIVPNVTRQIKSFPPNFIHSLESSHMMLTALNCHRQGVEFASIHDCFWTIPSTVDIMNKITREQFVLLHSQPLLENLASCIADLCVSQKRDGLNSFNTEIVRVLNSPPKRGNFDIKEVLKSTYFFC